MMLVSQEKLAYNYHNYHKWVDILREVLDRDKKEYVLDAPVPYEPTKEGMKPYIIEECVDEAEVKSLMIAFMDVKLGQVLTTVANMI
jgi:hypothetical protein